MTDKVMADKVSDNIIFTSMEIMFNNSDYSDIVFVVNKSKYHAQRFLLSVSSEVFRAMLTKEFKEAHQNEIVIPDVKHDESFYYILSYMYGMKIDFSSLDVEILCEIIGMAEYYHLPILFTSVQTHLNTIEKFDEKSVDVILNTAKLYKLDVFYTNCKNYILGTIHEFMKSGALTYISYDVLLDLMKSFKLRSGIPEISKLKFILDWFINNKQEMYSANQATLLDNIKDEEMTNFKKEKEDFFSTMLKEMNFNIICVNDHLKLFKNSDTYTQYEPIINNIVANNINLNIEVPNVYTQLSKKELIKFGPAGVSFSTQSFPLPFTYPSDYIFNNSDEGLSIYPLHRDNLCALILRFSKLRSIFKLSGAVTFGKPGKIPFYTFRFYNKLFVPGNLLYHEICEIPVDFWFQYSEVKVYRCDED